MTADPVGESSGVTPATYDEWVAGAARAGRREVPELMIMARDAPTPLTALAAIQSLGSMRTELANEALRRIARLKAWGVRRRVYLLATSFESGFGDAWGLSTLRQLVGGDLERPFAADEDYPPSLPRRGSIAGYLPVERLGAILNGQPIDGPWFRRIVALTNEVDGLASDGSLAESLPAFAELVKELPSSAWLHQAFALDLAACGRTTAAEEAATRAVELDPRAGSFLTRVRIRRLAGRMDEALVDVAAGLAAADEEASAADAFTNIQSLATLRATLHLERMWIESSRSDEDAAIEAANTARSVGSDDWYVQSSLSRFEELIHLSRDGEDDE